MDRMDQQVSNFLAALYEEATGEGEWTTIVSLLADLFDTPYGCFAPSASFTPSSFSFGGCFLRADLKSHDYDGPQLLLLEAHRLPTGTALVRNNLGRDERIAQTRLYTHGLKGCFEHVVMLFQEAKPLGNNLFSLQRHPSQSPFSRKEVRLFKFLSRHVVHAACLHKRLAEDRSHGHSLWALERLKSAAFLLSDNGAIVEVNSAAQALLEQDRYYKDIGGRLTLPIASPGLSRAIAELTGRSAVSDLVALTVGESEAGGARALLLPAPTEWCRGRTGQFVLLASGPADATPPAWVLSRQYGLTETEVRFVKEFARFLDIAQTAAALRIQPGTGRRHIKNIFEKTGTHSQVELLALLLNHPAAGI